MNSKNIKNLRPLTVSEFEILNKNASIIMLDFRHQNEFVIQHIPNSLFIGIEGPFDKWMQLLIPEKSTKLLLILPKDTELDCLNRLETLGYTNITGFLQGGIQSWVRANLPTTNINSISAKTFVLKRESENLNSIDVRKLSEFENSHIDDTTLCPLLIEKEFTKNFSPHKKYHLFCGGGYRSVIAISYLIKLNIKNITNIDGGYRSIQDVLSNSITNLNSRRNI